MDTCSFCGKSGKNINVLMRGSKDGIFICDSCVNIAYENLNPITVDLPPVLSSPKNIKAELDKFVIGQEQAKKILSIAAYNHILRTERKLNIQKGNVLLIGPSGSGKTYLCQILSKILNVPFVITDATSLTEEGYVGDNVETIIQLLFIKSDFDIEATKKGIIFIDEIDKKARKTGGNPSISRDVSGEGVQNSLLKIVEGTTVNLQPTLGRKHPQTDRIQIDTSGILFIFAGAFNGLDQIIFEKIGKNEIGFSHQRKDIEQINLNIEQEDLISYGIIPELIGRIPIISVLDELNINDLKRILIEPKDNLIGQYKILLEQDNINLIVSDDSLLKIADLAYKRKVGARALQSIIENILFDSLYERDNDVDIDKLIEEKYG